MNTEIDVCFLCTKNYKCVPVNKIIVSQVEYVLPEITIFKFGVPLRICSVCYEATFSFYKFKQSSLESSRRLEASIKDGAHVIDSEAYNTKHKLQNASLTDQQMAHTSLHTDESFPLEVFIKEEKEEIYQDHDYNKTEIISKPECTKNNSEEFSSSFNKFKQSYEQSSQEEDNTKPSTNLEKIEEIFIKEEQIDESFTDMPYFNSVLSNELKEDYSTNSSINTDTDGSTHVQKTTENWDGSSANCGKINTDDLKMNKNQETQCNICNEIFINKATLMQHIKNIHRQQKVFPCEMCGKIFSREYFLKRHLETHVKNINCPFCKERFSDNQSLKKHIKLHKERNDIRCETCNVTVTLESYLKDHVMHGEMQMQVKDLLPCPDCKALFKNKTELDIHMKLHSEVKDFLCQFCSKSFTLMTDLVRHLEESHYEVNDFKCEICNKSFIQKDDLVRHMDIHAVGNLKYNSDESLKSTPQELCEETENIMLELLPTKSRTRYERAYNVFVKWCEEKKVTKYTENVLLAYFKELVDEKRKALWVTYSMLKACIMIYKNIDISKYTVLIAYLKKKEKICRTKKTKVLNEEHIDSFIDQAPDHNFLMMKAVLIIAVSGGIGREDLRNMCGKDVELKDDTIIVTIPDSKNNTNRQFAIRNSKWIALIQKYIEKRSEITRMTDRFFLHYTQGHCIDSPVGINFIGSVPSQIAKFLNLENYKEYTGHSFRQSSASLLANRRDLITLIEQKRMTVTEEYEENCVKRKMAVVDPEPSTYKNPKIIEQKRMTVTEEYDENCVKRKMAVVESEPSTSKKPKMAATSTWFENKRTEMFSNVQNGTM